MVIKMNEHGWNDPPVFTYSSLQTGAGKKTQLTKRVNHELSAPPQPSPMTSNQALPTHPGSEANLSSGPPIKNVPLEKSSPICFTNITNNDQSPESEDTLPAQLVTLESVMECLHKTVEKHSNSMAGRTTNEVQSRLAIFSDQWKTGKLSEHVKMQMAKLAKALDEGNHSLADEIHVALMVDHVSEVSRWMVGVKRLIAVLKQQSS